MAVLWKLKVFMVAIKHCYVDGSPLRISCLGLCNRRRTTVSRGNAEASFTADHLDSMVEFVRRDLGEIIRTVCPMKVF